MSQIICNTVLCKFALDAVSRTAHSGSFRASALDHETVDDTVEDQSVVKALVHKTDKVVDCVWCDMQWQNG